MKMTIRLIFRLTAVFSALVLSAGCQSAPQWLSEPLLTPQQSGTQVLLQAVSPVSENVVWVSGHGGTWARTLDGGKTWESKVVPGCDTLQFRDVAAIDAQRAYLLSAGSGELSRIYKTVDGGKTWTEKYRNLHPDGFLNCMDFWDADHGMAYGDAIDGELFLLHTQDGGASWERVRAESFPKALPGEGGFAASGTCLSIAPDGAVWIGTGAGSYPRVLRSADRGKSWQVSDAPLPKGKMAGIFTLALRDGQNAMLLGGDLAQPKAYLDNIARTEDGGATWEIAGRPVLKGAFYGSAYVPDHERSVIVGVGPGGLDYSYDAGSTWQQADTLEYWAVGIASSRAGWAVGRNGSITKLKFAAE